MHIDSMKITITMLPGNTSKEIELDKGSTISDILQKIQLKPDTVIVTSNNMPVPINDVITKKQEFKIIQVASGG